MDSSDESSTRLVRGELSIKRWIILLEERVRVKSKPFKTAETLTCPSVFSFVQVVEQLLPAYATKWSAASAVMPLR